MKQIKELIRTAYEHVPYYNHILNHAKLDVESIDSLNKLPITTKEHIRQYGLLNFINNDFLDDNYQLNNTSDIVITTSSGTTGVPMDVIWNKKTYLSSTWHHWLFRLKAANIQPSDTFVTSQRFQNTSQSCIKKSDREYAINTNILNDETLTQALHFLKNINPKWMLIQPSVLYILVRYAEHINFSFPTTLKYVEYFSETLLPFYRHKIEQAINSTTANMYACSETNGIAYECSCHKLHLLDKNVFCEIIKRGHPVKPGCIGNVCVTNPHNYVMPIIRYKLNDKALINKKLCSCGLKSPTITLITTRIPEFILFDDLKYCADGQIFFPHNRLSFIEKKPNDILFNLRRKSLEYYHIDFIDPSCNTQKKWKLVKTFKTIMERYGLGDCNFQFGFRKELLENLPYGILRL